MYQKTFHVHIQVGLLALERHMKVFENGFRGVTHHAMGALKKVPLLNHESLAV